MFKSFKNYIHLLLIFFLAPIIIFPQSKNIHFKSLKGNIDAISTTYYTIHQDQYGFIWAGGQNGLSRYDGYNLKLFRHDKNDSNSISDSWVWCLYEDVDGLWVGTQDGGLNFYSFITGKFKHYINDKNDSTSISNDFVKVIIPDEKGNLWIGTNNGLNYFNKKDGTFKKYFHSDLNQKLKIGAVQSLFIDDNNTLWVGTANGLININSNFADYHIYRYDGNDKYSISNNNIHCINQFVAGTLLVGTSDGLNKYDIKLKRFETIDLGKNKSKTNGIYVTSIYEDNENKIWVGTFFSGLLEYDQFTKKTYNYSHDPYNSSSLLSDDITAIYQDAAGLVWIATKGGGISYFNPRDLDFLLFESGGLDNNKIHGTWVRAIFEDSKNRIWTGTNQGISLIDRSKNTTKYFTHISSDRKSLSGNRIRAIFEDSKKQIWIGYWIGSWGAFSRYDEDNDSFIHYQLKNDKGELTLDNTIERIYEDKHGNLWLGSFKSGAYVFNPEKNTFKQFVHNKDDSNSISDNDVRYFLEEKEIMWVLTSGGLNKYDFNSQSFKNYHYNPLVQNSLSSDFTRNMIKDTEGFYWIATRNGLNKFDPIKETFSQFTINEGLRSNILYSVIEDELGYLWVSSTRGLTRIDPKSNTVIYFNFLFDNTNDSYGSGAFFKGKNNEIMFGCNGGLVVFNPTLIFKNETSSQIRLTNLKIMNVEVKPNDKSLNGKSILNTDIIELSYNQNILSLEFALLSYLNSSQNHYKYKLEGFNSDWVDLDHKHDITFTNLAPKEYTLYIEGSNYYGTWNNKGYRLKIIITPAWWQTILFKTIIILFAASLIFMFYQIRVRGIKKYNKILKNHNNELSEEVRKRAIVEASLENKINLEKLLNKISSEYIQINYENINEKTWNTLNSIANFIHAENSFILTFDDDEIISSVTISLNSKPIRIAGSEICISNEDNKLCETLSEENLIVSDIDFLEYELQTKIKELRSVDVKSIIIIPFITNNKLNGFFGFETIKKINDWNEDAVVVVKTFGSILFNTLNKIKAQKKLGEFNKELETIVQERTKELQQVNADLESFSYSVSHDLRTPLRSIDGFGQALFEDYSDDLPNGAKKFITKMRDGAQRMSNLINDLLNFAKISKAALQKEDVNFTDMSSQILNEITNHDSDRKLDIKIAENLTCYADKSLTRILLQNLIENAYKFTKYEPTAEIEIGFSKRHNGKTNVFFIKDNGVGFNLNYKDKLFKPFQRLHSTKDFEGTGIGLAIVSRIISAHGGDIWVDSELNLGSTFYFKFNP